MFILIEDMAVSVQARKNTFNCSGEKSCPLRESDGYQGVSSLSRFPVVECKRNYHSALKSL